MGTGRRGSKSLKEENSLVVSEWEAAMVNKKYADFLPGPEKHDMLEERIDCVRGGQGEAFCG